jgi:hypothetical protein
VTRNLPNVAASFRTPDPHRRLRRAASALYRRRVRPALKTALVDVKPGARLDDDDYVVDVADNLLPGLRVADIKKEFKAGAGGELKGKMRAPWSSSALAVNSFLPWRTSRKAVGLLGLGPLSPTFTFEAKCPNKVSGTPPHLDVLFETDTAVVAVESKCTEFVQGSAHKAVSARYLALEARRDPRASSRWFAVLSQTAAFPLLDSYQLVKHFLGLRNTYPDRALTLVYLYWEPPNADREPVFLAHRDEVARFAALVAGDETCRFVHASYAELWREWAGRRDDSQWLARHLELLARRYLVAI